MRMSTLACEEARAVLKVFVSNLIQDAVVYTEHANRKTVTMRDVVYALQYQGRTIYRYD
jgi:histone H4